MNDLAVVAVPGNNARQVNIRGYVPDTTAPVLRDFSLDMNTATLLMTFSETMDVTSLASNVDAITIQNPAGSSAVRLSASGNTVFLDDSTILSVTFNDADGADWDRIKLLQDLATSHTDTVLVIAMSAVHDTADIPVFLLPVSQNLIAANYRADTQNPSLRNFEARVNDSLLILNFDEPVDISELVVQHITFQSGANINTAAQAYTLRFGSTNSPDGRQVRIDIHVDDLNEIKRLDQLLISQDSSFLSFPPGLITDMAGLPVIAIQPSLAQMAAVFENDTTRPRIRQFHLDMDDGILHLTFPETMDASSVNFSAIVLQTASNVMLNSSMHQDIGLGSLITLQNDSTVISIVIHNDDLNEVKRKEIGSRRLSSWLVFGPSAISDMNMLEVIPLFNGISSLVAQDYTYDRTRPRVTHWVLNMNTHQLEVFFTETVDIRRFNVSTLTIQSRQNYIIVDTLRVHLNSTTGSRVLSTIDGPSALIQLSTADSNNVKLRIDLATSVNNSFLTYLAGTVFDKQQNYLEPGTLQVSNFTSDRVSPNIIAFRLDLDSGNLTLSFDEVVNSTTLDKTSIVFSNSQGASVTLTGGLLVDCYGTDVVLVLNDRDLNLIKFQTQLCLTADVGFCFLHLLDNAIADISGNLLNNSNIRLPIAPSQLIPDRTAPSVVSYDLDLNTGQLLLTMSEHVRLQNDRGAPPFIGIDPMQISIQAGRFSNDTFAAANVTEMTAVQRFWFEGVAERYTLTGGTFNNLSTSNTIGYPPVIVVLLTETDLNVLRSLRRVATSRFNTFLTVTNQLCEDPFTGIANAPILNGNAQQVRLFTGDITRPTLLSYSLDMNMGTVDLTFSETVNVSSLVPSAIVLQGDRTLLNSLAIAGSTTASQDNPVVRLVLSFDDLNSLKLNRLLATSHNNTFLSLSTSAVSDMAGNPVVEVTSRLPLLLQESEFTSDTTLPELVSWNLDMNSGVINMTFTEAVDSATLEPRVLHFQDAMFERSAGYTLRNATVLNGDGVFMAVRISDGDLNNIKVLDLCTRQSLGGDCFLTYPTSLIQDMNFNVVLDAMDGNGTQVTRYTVDSISPRILRYDVLMSHGEVRISFSESVNVSTFDPTGLTFNPSASPNNPRNLTGGTRLTNTSGLQLRFVFNQDDLEHFRMVPNFLDTIFNTYMRALPRSILDMSGNELDLYPSTGFFDDPTLFVPDGVSPTLLGFSLDMNSTLLTLTFSESVSNALALTDITLLDSFFGNSSHQLTGGRVLQTGAHFELTILLSADDVFAIQADDTLAKSLDTSWLVHGSSLTRDSGNNAIIPRLVGINATRASTYQADAIDPTVFQFQRLDLNDRELIVFFDEPVNISGANAALFQVQQFSNNSGIQYQLTGGTFSYDTRASGVLFPQRTARSVIILSLTPQDYKSLVLNTSLATSVLDSHLVLPRGAIVDMAGNDLVAVPPVMGRAVNQFIGDMSQPRIEQFYFDLDAGTITLSFSSVLDVGSFNPAALTLQNAMLSTVEYTLVTGFTDSAPDFSITVHMSNSDLNEVKRRTALATGLANTYIRIAASFINGISGNDIIAVTDGSARQAANFTIDTTRPQLTNYTLDLNQGLLRLSFDETMQASLFNLTRLSFHNMTTNSTSYYHLTDNSTLISNDDPVMIVSLNFIDLNALKLLTNLATDSSNTFLSFDTRLAVDMSGNPVIPVSNISAVQIMGGVIPDTTSPTVEQFSLDMDGSPRLSLTFSEAVNAETLDASFIQLQETVNFVNGEAVVLSSASGTLSPNGHVIHIDLTR